MSLRVVHIVVIVLSIGITLFFGFWAVRDYLDHHNTANLCWGVASLAGGLALIPYLIWFFLKTRKRG